MKKWYYFIVVVALSVLYSGCSADMEKPGHIDEPNKPGKIDPPIDELIKDTKLEKHAITNVKTKTPRKAESNHDSIHLPDYDTCEQDTL